MVRFRAVVIWTLMLVLIAGCQGKATVPPSSAAPELTYTVGECRQDIPMGKLASWAGVDVRAQEGTVSIDQRIDYVCCAEIEARLEVEGQVVRIVETNIGQVCKCMCGYDLQGEITGLPPGSYTVEVWGVQHQDVHPLELLGQAEATLP